LLFDVTALTGHLLADLSANLTPQTFVSRRRKRLNLKCGTQIIKGHSNYPLGSVFNLDTQTEPLARNELDAAEINPWAHPTDF
jgi:hypothetical protein